MEGTIDFKKTFIDIDFDDMLLRNNNPLINSDDHYLKYKQNYKTTSLANFETYTDLQRQLASLGNLQFHKPTATKYIYTHIKSDKLDTVHREISSLLQRQNKLFEQFTNYITFLNNNFNKIMASETTDTDLPKKSKSSWSLNSFLNNISTENLRLQRFSRK